jgi:mRNA interferase RelE/StbE
MYQVLLRPAAQRDLKKLPKRVFARISEELGRLSDNPRPRGVKKLSGQENEWRLRTGDYRILYEISDSERVVRIFRIAHRREAYH